MHISQALSRLQQQHGEHFPLPRYLQYASVICALNEHYGLSRQHVYRENVLLTHATEAAERCSGELPFAVRASRFAQIVDFVGDYLDGDGSCLLKTYTHIGKETHAGRIADYLSSLPGHWQGQVLPAHVRAAQKVIHQHQERVA